METVNIKEEMQQYFNQLNTQEQESILNLVKTFISSRHTAFGPVTLEEYNRELEEADEEIEAGDYVMHEDVKEKYLKSK